MASGWRLAVLAALSMALPACDSGSPTPPSNVPAPTPPPATPPPVTERNIEVVSTDVPKDIPNRTTTQSVVDVAATGVVLDVLVDVVISHTWRGDIELRLRHPDGTTAVIFTPSGGDSRDDIIGTLGIVNAPNLAQMLNRQSQGRWTLQIIDGQPQDNGRLISWGLRLRVRG